jgi:hypothetical protein
MNFWEFADKNVVGVLFAVWIVARLIFCCWNRLLRSFNLNKLGWPPAHCDADGDFLEKSEP